MKNYLETTMRINGSTIRPLTAFLLACTSAALVAIGYAATPPSGTIGPASKPVTWMGDAPVGVEGGAAGEATCVDGVNCDVFTLTVTGKQTDWAGKQIAVTISWNLPASDYDFYIHKDTVDGTQVSSGENGGPPATSDQAVINPATTGTGKYVVHVVYASGGGPADQYTGTATVKTAAGPGPTSRTAKYITGAATGIRFSDSIPLKAPLTTRDGEPSNRTDYVGNTYVGAIRGFPAGVDLWHINLNPKSASYDPFMRVPSYRGQPDKFSPTDEADLGGDGGGDIDLAVPHPSPGAKPNPASTPTLAFSSLIAANISTGVSTDGGRTFTKNPLGNCTGGVCADDRQWEEFLGETSVYMLYRTLDPAVTQIQRSDDSGLTFGPAATAGAIGQVGYIDVHQSDGVVYASGSSGQVAVGVPSLPGLAPTSADYNVVQVANDPNGVAHLFFEVKVADDGTPNGTAYVCYSNENNVYLQHSTDQGKTWSKPVKVNGGIPTKVNIFPWMETGPTPGSVGVVWYGTTAASNSDVAEWRVYFAQSFDASADSPTFKIAEVTEPEHIIHGSNISEGGLTGAANRNLIDYFQISFDPNGAAVVAYTDDHNDYDGHTYVAHQIAGASINNGAPLPHVAEGSLKLPPGDEFPPRVPGLNGEQVTDYAQDLQESSVARVHANDPSDVLAVQYATSGTGDKLAVAATIKVSDLSIIPGQTTWQMSFAVNAPHNVMSPTNTYSFGVSDHADQFYLQADTNVNGAQTFTYGTVERASDGKLIYTKVGDADAGEFNQDDNTVSVQVSVAKLNAVLAKAKHGLIKNGTVISGLRGRSYTIEVVPPVSGQASRNGRRDIARGGTQFVVHDSAFAYPKPTPSPTPLPPLAKPASTATPPPVELANISTRVAVRTGDEVAIGGFIIRGSEPKRVLVRGVGPSLNGLAGLANPHLRLISEADGSIVAENNGWRASQQAEISATNLAPKSDKEAALIAELAPGSYTAILSGDEGSTGIGLIEAYDLEAEHLGQFRNISTRGFVGSNNDVLIGGFILRDNTSHDAPRDIVVRALGPSLTSKGVQGALADPVLGLFNANGTRIRANNNWRDSQEAALMKTGLAPKDDHESAILQTVAPGAYTAIVQGKSGTGVGLVEVYNLGAP